MLQRELSPRADPAAILALRRIIRQRRPDVLHTHTAKAGATGRLAAVSSGRARPRAIVHTYHGHVLSGYFSRRWERVFRWIEKGLALTSGTLIAVSEEVRDDLVGFGVAPARRFVVVPYGFELPPWSEADDEARRTLRAEIGADDEHVRRRLGRAPDRDQASARPDPDAAHAPGRGASTRCSSSSATARTARTWRRSPRSSRSPTSCRLVGFQKSIRPWYASFDALLLTSANEGTPVVAIEALAAARPVVATRAGGTGTVVRNGESGYLEAIGDTAALADRLALLARDPELRARMGAHGAEDVRERFAVGRMADEVEAIYRRLLR